MTTPVPFLKRTGSDDFPSLLKVLISGSPKSGKMLANGTPVLTSSGWRPIESLVSGDHVIGSNGYPTRVIGVFPQGVKPMRQVITDDGGRVLAGGTHLWTVVPHGKKPRTETTDEIARRMANDLRYAYLPVVEPVQFKDRLGSDVIPPYVLGLLLGDGALGNGSIVFTKPEPELWIAIKELLPDHDIKEVGDGKSIRINGLRPAIEALGLDVRSEMKFIPEHYLWTSIENRLALLAGLLDTDGGMNGKSICFYTSSARLRDDVTALVRSLGGCAVTRTKPEPEYAYRGENLLGLPAFNVSIRLPFEFDCPFRLERKIAAWNNGTVKRLPSRRIVSIEAVEDMDATCIKVAAPDGLFVTQDFIVTHNTTLLGSVPNIIIADTEPFANNLQSIAHRNLPYVTVNGTPDLHRLVNMLRDKATRDRTAADLGIPSVDAVGIDTLDSLQQIMKKERMRETRQSTFLRDDWGWLKEEMVTLLRAFTSLPMHVFFVVHTKTAEIGKGDDARTIVLPGLQGAIAEDIAGLVGYSLLTFRKQEIRPDGSPYTKYWLRAEGDETYGFLGNRAAGRLPDVIEPSFRAIFDAAAAGRAMVQPVVQPVQHLNIETTASTAPGVTGNGATAPPALLDQAPAQQAASVAPEHVEPAPAQEHATVAGQPADVPPGDDEPVNAAALTFVKKVYDANGLEFPEDLIRALNMGQARTLVRYWQAVQQDEVEGKLDKSASDEITLYLDAQGWLAGADMARIHPAETEGGSPQVTPPPEQPAPVADIGGTIPQVMAYIGDSLPDAQEVYDLEMRREKPRATLINALTAMGVTVQTPVHTPAPAVLAPLVAAVAETVAAIVTPEPPVAEVSTVEDDVTRATLAHVEEVLGAVPIGADGAPVPCGECGGVVDDEDIATLGMSRYGRRLCVGDYLAESKKTRV